MAITEDKTLYTGMVEKPLLKTDKGVIYQSELYRIEQEYTDNLPDPSIVNKSIGFIGLLEYVYSHLLYDIGLKHDNGTYNIQIIDAVFDKVFIPLCARHNIVPTVIQFTNMCKIAHRNVVCIHTTGTDTNGKAVSFDTIQTVEKWFNSCESGLTNKVSNENGVGAMFLLKAQYGYVEQQHVVIDTTSNTTEDSSSIIERHRMDTLKLPEKPKEIV